MSEADLDFPKGAIYFMALKKGALNFVIKIPIFRFDFLDKGVRTPTCMGLKTGRGVRQLVLYSFIHCRVLSIHIITIYLINSMSLILPVYIEGLLHSLSQNHVRCHYHRPAASDWQTLSQYRIHLTWVWCELTMLVVIGTDCIGSHKSN